MSTFAVYSVFASVIVVAIAWGYRSREYALFRGVILALYTLFACEMRPYFDWCAPAFIYLHVMVYVQSVVLVRPRMMPFFYRALVSIPGLGFSAGTLLAMPWVITSALEFEPWGPWIPYGLALLGTVQSLTSRREVIDLVIADGEQVHEIRSHDHGERRVARPLLIVQISDPHLGPFMSVKRLRRICERAVAHSPDLVFLTGDFLTMESQARSAWLADALQPLQALKGRVFACYGNHDHEARASVNAALDAVGAVLLVDEAVTIKTAVGRVQIVGMDFCWRNHHDAMAAVCRAYPRESDALRIVLLHDPGAYKHLPPDESDLVLSGHIHGGQVGLVSLGMSWTFVRLFTSIPEHGFWANGKSRLWVHRGTGHYGFPLRIGVPAEESLLRLHIVGETV